MFARHRGCDPGARHVSPSSHAGKAQNGTGRRDTPQGGGERRGGGRGDGAVVGAYDAPVWKVMLVILLRSDEKG